MNAVIVFYDENHKLIHKQDLSESISVSIDIDTIRFLVIRSKYNHKSTTMWKHIQKYKIFNLTRCQCHIDDTMLLKATVILSSLYRDHLITYIVESTKKFDEEMLIKGGFLVRDIIRINTEDDKRKSRIPQFLFNNRDKDVITSCRGMYTVPNTKYPYVLLENDCNTYGYDDYEYYLEYMNRFGEFLPNQIRDIKLFDTWISERIYISLLNLYTEIHMYKLKYKHNTQMIDPDDQIFGLLYSKTDQYYILSMRLEDLKEYINVYLNSQPFATVPLLYKGLYAETCRQLALLHAYHGEYISAINEADDGIMKGAQSEDRNLSKLATFLSNKRLEKLPQISVPEFIYEIGYEVKDNVYRCSLPSLEEFYNWCVKDGKPMIIKDLVNKFPIYRFFDFDYLNEYHGYRKVPIEFGSSYASKDFYQKIVTIHEYLRDYVSNKDAPPAYLAQHALLDQLDLTNAVITPDYCSMINLDNNQDVEPTINMFIGPEGTLSPMHYDPRPNFFCQLRGKKYVQLVNPKYLPKMYMGTGPMRSHICEPDMECPDYRKYPLLKEIEIEEFIVEPGDCLFMPAKYLHLMRSLTPSISMSIWV